MSEYKTVVSQSPPVLKQLPNGEWVIQIVNGPVTFEAKCGKWFVSQLMTRVVLTQLVLDAAKEPHPRA